jgi:DHA2 family multidrug resistance protein-like MFS transporter
MTAAVMADAKSAFVAGLRVVVIVSSLLHGALGVLGLRWLPRRGPDPAARAGIPGQHASLWPEAEPARIQSPKSRSHR